MGPGPQPEGLIRPPELAHCISQWVRLVCCSQGRCGVSEQPAERGAGTGAGTGAAARALLSPADAARAH